MQLLLSPAALAWLSFLSCLVELHTAMDNVVVVLLFKLDKPGSQDIKALASSPSTCIVRCDGVKRGRHIHECSTAEAVPGPVSPPGRSLRLGRALASTSHAMTMVVDLLRFVQLVRDAQPEGRMKCQAPLGNCLAGCVPFAKIVPAVRPADMSQDPQVVREYLEDPLNYVDDVKARTGNEVLKGFKAMQKLRSKISVPLYACHGTMDRCTSLQAVKDLLKASSSQDKTLNEIPGGYHELLMGPE
ncbi:hydrolase_4 domain-containing protein, partial [Haematococcus lacustris]